jgi:hypothetical protein
VTLASEPGKDWCLRHAYRECQQPQTYSGVSFAAPAHAAVLLQKPQIPSANFLLLKNLTEF